MNIEGFSRMTTPFLEWRATRLDGASAETYSGGLN